MRPSVDSQLSLLCRVTLYTVDCQFSQALCWDMMWPSSGARTVSRQSPGFPFVNENSLASRWCLAFPVQYVDTASREAAIVSRSNKDKSYLGCMVNWKAERAWDPGDVTEPPGWASLPAASGLSLGKMYFCKQFSSNDTQPHCEAAITTIH